MLAHMKSYLVSSPLQIQDLSRSNSYSNQPLCPPERSISQTENLASLTPQSTVQSLKVIRRKLIGGSIDHSKISKKPPLEQPEWISSSKKNKIENIKGQDFNKRELESNDAEIVDNILNAQIANKGASRHQKNMRDKVKRASGEAFASKVFDQVDAGDPESNSDSDDNLVHARRSPALKLSQRLQMRNKTNNSSLKDQNNRMVDPNHVESTNHGNMNQSPFNRKSKSLKTEASNAAISSPLVSQVTTSASQLRVNKKSMYRSDSTSSPHRNASMAKKPKADNVTPKKEILSLRAPDSIKKISHSITEDIPSHSIQPHNDVRVNTTTIRQNRKELVIEPSLYPPFEDDTYDNDKVSDDSSLTESEGSPPLAYRNRSKNSSSSSSSNINKPISADVSNFRQKMSADAIMRNKMREYASKAHLHPPNYLENLVKEELQQFEYEIASRLQSPPENPSLSYILSTNMKPSSERGVTDHKNPSNRSYLSPKQLRKGGINNSSMSDSHRGDLSKRISRPQKENLEIGSKDVLQDRLKASPALSTRMTRKELRMRTSGSSPYVKSDAGQQHSNGTQNLTSTTNSTQRGEPRIVEVISQSKELPRKVQSTPNRTSKDSPKVTIGRYDDPQNDKYYPFVSSENDQDHRFHHPRSSLDPIESGYHSNKTLADHLDRMKNNNINNNSHFPEDNKEFSKLRDRDISYDGDNSDVSDDDDSKSSQNSSASFQRLLHWLEEIGIHRYGKYFRRHEIRRLSEVELLNLEDLLAMGIPSPEAHRIHYHIRELSARTRSLSEQVLRWEAARTSVPSSPLSSDSMLESNSSPSMNSVDLERVSHSMGSPTLASRMSPSVGNSNSQSPSWNNNASISTPVIARNPSNIHSSNIHSSSYSSNSSSSNRQSSLFSVNMMEMNKSPSLDSSTEDRWKIEAIQALQKVDRITVDHYWSQISGKLFGGSSWLDLLNPKNEENPNHPSSITLVIQHPSLARAFVSMDFYLHVYFLVATRLFHHSINAHQQTLSRFRIYLQDIVRAMESHHPSEYDQLPLSPLSSKETTQLLSSMNHHDAAAASSWPSLSYPSDLSSSPTMVGQISSSVSTSSSMNPSASENRMNGRNDFPLSSSLSALWKSKEFAMFSALAMIPFPEMHPLFQPLFSLDWLSGLVKRFQVFLSLLQGFVLQPMGMDNDKSEVVVMTTPPLSESETMISNSNKVTISLDSSNKMDDVPSTTKVVPQSSSSSSSLSKLVQRNLQKNLQIQPLAVPFAVKMNKNKNAAPVLNSSSIPSNEDNGSNNSCAGNTELIGSRSIPPFKPLKIGLNLRSCSVLPTNPESQANMSDEASLPSDNFPCANNVHKEDSAEAHRINDDDSAEEKGIEEGHALSQRENGLEIDEPNTNNNNIKAEDPLSIIEAITAINVHCDDDRVDDVSSEPLPLSHVPISSSDMTEDVDTHSTASFDVEEIRDSTEYSDESRKVEMQV